MVKLKSWLATSRFERFITGLIVLNALTLGLETSPAAMQFAGPVLVALDGLILGIFVVEIGLRVVAHRLDFFRDPWSVFDLIVVAIALLPATGNLSILRALRVLRILRLVSAVASMRRVVGGLLHALPGMGSIVALLGLIFYVSSVMATKLFGPAFPVWFGSIGESAYTLFQIMTLESWSMGIVRPVMDMFGLAWLFFVPFILATSFTVLNLFIGVIVDAMQNQHEVEVSDARDAHKAETATILAELRSLRREVRALRLKSDF